MANKPERELTALEYVILGFLAVKPQSGYAIISRVEAGMYRWSASAGSIYPVLKRLEQAVIINSQLEGDYEARPRKVYALLPKGEQLLDAWLKQPPTMREVIEEYDMALHKFLIAEYRLTRSEVLDWLTAYRMIIQGAEQVNRVMDQSTGETALTLHEWLTHRSITLEIQARLIWVQEAVDRLNQKG